MYLSFFVVIVTYIVYLLCVRSLWFQGQFARKLRNICGLVWWVAFLQTVPEMTNFCLNVKSVSYINIDFLYFYFAHFIGYSSGLK